MRELFLEVCHDNAPEEYRNEEYCEGWGTGAQAEAMAPTRLGAPEVRADNVPETN